MPPELPITGSMLRDLVVCERRVHHDLHGDAGSRDQVSSFVEMLWAGGNAHEAEILASVGDAATLVDLRGVPLPLRAAATVEAMRSPKILWIAGGRIVHEDLLGMPDLLHRLSSAEPWRAGDIKAGSPFAQDGVRPKNVWPAPSARVNSRQLAGLHQRIRSQGLALAKMGSARSRPHKERGVEHHIFSQAAGAPVRPLSHLSSTSTDFVRGDAVKPSA